MNFQEGSGMLLGEKGVKPGVVIYCREKGYGGTVGIIMKSKYQYNGKNLSDLKAHELLEAVDGMWSAKNAEIQALEAIIEAQKHLLYSSHNLWREYADNVLLVLWVMAVLILLAKMI